MCEGSRPLDEPHSRILSYSVCPTSSYRLRHMQMRQPTDRPTHEHARTHSKTLEGAGLRCHIHSALFGASCWGAKINPSTPVNWNPARIRSAQSQSRTKWMYHPAEDHDALCLLWRCKMSLVRTQTEAKKSKTTHIRHIYVYMYVYMLFTLCFLRHFPCVQS